MKFTSGFATNILNTTSQIGQAPTGKKWPLTFIFIFLLVLLSRCYYVENFVVAMPFWDQWDAEGDGLLRPWVEGQFRISDLWYPQNEHRLLPSRILTLLIYEVTGTWSNLTETRVNVVLGALSPILLIGFVYRLGALFGWRWLVVGVVVAGAILPFSWENILVGFQSQFYFLCLFAILSFGLTAVRPYKASTLLIVFSLSVLSILTMATGLLTPIAVAGIYILHGLISHEERFKQFLAPASFLLLALIGYLTMPYNAGHDALHAQSAEEFFKALIRVLGWPLTARKLSIIVFWLPAAAILTTLVFRRKLNRMDLLMAGCFIWSGLQAIAIAYGRGHEVGAVISRYTDVLSPGVAGNAWFIIRATEVFGPKGRFKYSFQILAILFFTALIVSHKKRFSPDIQAMANSKDLRTLEAANVYRYLETGNDQYLKTGKIPYPKPDRLKILLDNRAIREMLPAEK